TTASVCIFKRSTAQVSDSRSHVPKNPVPPVMNSRASRNCSQTGSVHSRTCSRSAGGRLDMLARRAEAMHGFQNVTEHGRREARIHSDPEDLVHDEIGVPTVADDAMRHVAVRRLPQEIAREEEPRPDLRRFQITDQFVPG